MKLYKALILSALIGVSNASALMSVTEQYQAKCKSLGGDVTQNDGALGCVNLSNSDKVVLDNFFTTIKELTAKEAKEKGAGTHIGSAIVANQNNLLAQKKQALSKPNGVILCTDYLLGLYGEMDCVGDYVGKANLYTLLKSGWHIEAEMTNLTPMVIIFTKK